MNVSGNQYLSIEQLRDQYFKQQKQNSNNVVQDGLSFEEILQRHQTTQTGEVKFSKHATNRLSDRNIELTAKQLERLNDGTRKAEAKGIKESLVLVDKLAFIVNTKNNTVITAMDQTETDDNIFTNIDGAVII